MISEAQHRKYFKMWSPARQALRKSGLPPKDADARRHEIHVGIFGKDKSHWKLTDDELDEVFGAFVAISEPSNLVAQLHYMNMRKRRRLYRIRELADESYVASLVKRMNAEGKLRTFDLEQMGIPELDKVVTALRKHEARGVVYEPCVAGDTSTADVRSSAAPDPF